MEELEQVIVNSNVVKILEHLASCFAKMDKIQSLLIRLFVNIITFDRLRWAAHLFLDPVNNCFGSAASAIF